MKIYKNYTRQELDRQYNARAAVPDFAAVVQDWERRSEACRQTVSCKADLAYGPGEREKLDFFPVGGGTDSAGLLVFFHGGYWQSMDKRLFHFMVEPFAAGGLAVALVNYPLAPAADMDQIVESCRRAVAWLYAHAAELRFDRSRMVVSGHSAGGHIVAMLMAGEPGGGRADAPRHFIKAGIALSGLFDLHPIHLTYLNQALQLDAAAAERNSPVLLAPAAGCPLWACVGALESDEFKAQSAAIVAAWGRQGAPVELLEVAGANHFSILDHLGEPNSSLHRFVLRCLA